MSDDKKPEPVQFLLQPINLLELIETVAKAQTDAVCAVLREQDVGRSTRASAAGERRAATYERAAQMGDQRRFAMFERGLAFLQGFLPTLLGLLGQSPNPAAVGNGAPSDPSANASAPAN